MLSCIFISLILDPGKLAVGKEVWHQSNIRFNGQYELDLNSNFVLKSADDLSYVNSRERRATLNCKKKEFRCLNNQCISNNLFCNGEINCDDGSDEKSTICKNIKCPDGYVSCYYGACIHNLLQCNGVENCKDGSDEDGEFCRKYTAKRLQTLQSTNQSNAGGGCGSDANTEECLPKEQEVEDISTTPSKEETNGFIPDAVPANNAYQFACLSGEKIEDSLVCDGKDDCYDGSDETIAKCIGMSCAGYLFQCAYGGCIEESKKCNGEVDCKDGSDEDICDEKAHVPLRFCPKLVTDSVVITCHQMGKRVNCSHTAWPGTIVIAECKPAYHRAEPLRGFQEARCLQGGRWNHPLFTCVPDCGERYTVKTLSWHSSTVKGYEYPWHVGLYKDNGRKYQCGGSIISSKAVISAAHCVYEDKNKPGAFVIALGKIWRTWNTTQMEPYEQRFKVTEIIIAEGYRGSQSLYAQDIAILALDRQINISVTTMPICYDRDQTYPVITTGQGTILGWGKTENESLSDLLRVAKLPIFTVDQCVKLVLRSFEQYITVDKFCAGMKGKNVTHLDVGDSGGSLSFPRTVKNQELYFLEGIVSLTDGSDSNSFALFTNISMHIQWINKILFAIEKKKIEMFHLTKGYY